MKRFFTVGVLAILALFGGMAVRYFTAAVPHITQEKSQVSEESLDSILAKAEKIENLQFEMDSIVSVEIATSSINFATTTKVSEKIWKKQSYGRLDAFDGQGKIFQRFITRPDGIFSYDPLEDKYYQRTKQEIISQFPEQASGIPPSDLLKNPTLKKIGVETIDGKLATVISYTDTITGFPIATKQWIWNEKGIILKGEATWQVLITKTFTHYTVKNIDFSNVPDNTFDIPKDKIVVVNPPASAEPPSGLRPISLSLSDIRNILGKASQAGPVQYDSVGSVSVPSFGKKGAQDTLYARVWQNDSNMRIEVKIGKLATTTTITRLDASYSYDPQGTLSDRSKKYSKLPSKNFFTIQFVEKSLEELGGKIKANSTLKGLGETTVGGKETVVVEYTEDIEGGSVINRLWLWEEKGLPLKEDIIIKSQLYNTFVSVENRNFIFGPISDVQFGVSN